MALPSAFCRYYGVVFKRSTWNCVVVCTGLTLEEDTINADESETKNAINMHCEVLNEESGGEEEIERPVADEIHWEEFTDRALQLLVVSGVGDLEFHLPNIKYA